MTFNADSIINAQFSLARLGGYNKSEVDQLLETIANEYEKLEIELKKAKAYKSKADQFDENYKEIQEALVVAQKSKKSIVSEAESNAKQLMDRAKHEAELSLYDAKKKADQLTSEAQREADNIRRQSADEANQLAQEVQRDTQQLISESKRIANEIIEDAHKTAKKIIDEIERERNNYKKVHSQLLSIVSSLQKDLEHDDWLNSQLSYKTASFEETPYYTKQEIKKEQKKVVETPQIELPEKKEVTVLKQSKKNPPLPMMTEEQMAAFESLQRSNETIQKTFVENAAHKQIETPEQAMDLLNKMNSNINDKE